MAFQKIYVGENVQGFTFAPKFEAVDKIILNIDKDNYVSSPYAKIIDVTEVSKAEDMTDTSIVYGYVGKEEGYAENNWYIYRNGQWTPNGEYTPWRSRRNATYVFEYDAEQGKWNYDGDLYTASQMQTEWCVEMYFASSDAAKAGDKITVIKFGDSDQANEKESKQSLQLQCDISRSGRVMEGNCPLCKPSARQTIADNLLRSLKGMTYQPYTATGAEVNPLAELGDGITAHGVYGGLYQQDLDFNSLMNSSIGAPADEELDHEFTYESATERRYNRQFADVGSELEIHSDEISARVTRTGTGDGFSWSLLETAFIVSKLGKTPVDVLTIDKTGLHVIGDGTFTGTVEAGKFLGGTIKIGKTWAGEEETTSDIETDEDGNRFKYNFSVDQNGAVIARDLTLMGGEIKLGPQTYYDREGNRQLAGYAFELSKTNGIKLGPKTYYDDYNDKLVIAGYSFEVTSQGALNLGAVMDEDNNISHNFVVDRSGRVSAKGLSMDGGSIKIYREWEETEDNTDEHRNKNPYVFSVDQRGNVEARSLKLTGGSISLGEYEIIENGQPRFVPAFSVSPSGYVTAYSLSLKGGSISIGEAEGGGPNFYVSSDGNLTANDGLFKGNVYASNIQYGSTGGYFNGAGLTPDSIAYNSKGALGVSWFDGATGGNKFGLAIDKTSGSYPQYFEASHVQATSVGVESGLSCNSITLGGDKLTATNIGYVNSVTFNPVQDVAYTYDYDGNSYEIYYVSDIEYDFDKDYAYVITASDGN